MVEGCQAPQTVQEDATRVQEDAPASFCMTTTRLTMRISLQIEGLSWISLFSALSLCATIGRL